ncbi:hypothetical protein DUI87_21138 [Hirundo rustica rustica]|uniref:Uncharacterized protein n=1 Tax=Hirundo rustica rustica TaxID=333673 RepID=A0A3M0JLW7_HIRRU|nr:hypothetical protein DUI87_21138 [Hirundo rustica rustica]
MILAPGLLCLYPTNVLASKSGVHLFAKKLGPGHTKMPGNSPQSGPGVEKVENQLCSENTVKCKAVVSDVKMQAKGKIQARKEKSLCFLSPDTLRSETKLARSAEEQMGHCCQYQSHPCI